MNRRSLQTAAPIWTPGQDHYIPIAAVALQSHKEEYLAKEDIVFPSLIAAHVASALCLFGGDYDLIGTILNPVWVGSGRSPYRRMGHLGTTQCTLGSFQTVSHFFIDLSHNCFIFISQNWDNTKWSCILLSLGLNTHLLFGIPVHKNLEDINFIG